MLEYLDMNKVKHFFEEAFKPKYLSLNYDLNFLNEAEKILSLKQTNLN
jgi:hypothetical protein